MKNKLFILIIIFLSLKTATSQNYQLDIFAGYAGLQDGNVVGISIGTNINRKIYKHIKAGVNISCFYGTTDRASFSTSEKYGYTVMIISNDFVDDKYQYPLYNDKLLNEIKKQGLIPLQSKFERHFYMPIILNISDEFKIGKKYSFEIMTGFGITYIHSKSMFMAVEGDKVIESSNPKLKDKDISYLFENYYRTLVYTFNFDISYKYYFNERSFIGISGNSFTNKISSLIQINFNIGTNF